MTADDRAWTQSAADDDTVAVDNVGKRGRRMGGTKGVGVLIDG